MKLLIKCKNKRPGIMLCFRKEIFKLPGSTFALFLYLSFSSHAKCSVYPTDNRLASKCRHAAGFSDSLTL